MTLTFAPPVRPSHDLSDLFADIPVPGESGESGFTIDVRLPDDDSLDQVNLAEFQKAISQVVRQWLPEADVRAALSAADDETFDPTNQDLSIFDRLPPLPTKKTQIIVGLEAATVNGHDIQLSPQELSLLRCLTKRPDQIVTREHMIGCAWEGQQLRENTRTIDVHIRRLREKVQLPSLISTIRGRGYRINSSVADLVFIPLVDQNAA